MPKGRSTRLALRATADLSEGRDVVIVAFDRPTAKSIAQTVCRLARSLGIPCANVSEARGEDSDGLPRVRIREHFDPIEVKRFERVSVYIDHSAVGERAGEWALTTAHREVFT